MMRLDRLSRGLRRTVLASTILCGGVLAAAAQDSAASVADLVKQGYQIASVFPIEGGYGVFLTKAGNSLLCQISFDKDRKAFLTDRAFRSIDPDRQCRRGTIDRGKAGAATALMRHLK